ncbi:MAG: SpoIIE family protein phosphatase [Planctomycetota bacterium]
MRGETSFYRSLLTSLLLVVVLLSGTILTISAVQARRALETASTRAIESTLEDMEGKLQRFFEPAQRGLMLMRTWGAQGRLDFADAEEFTQSMSPIIDRYPQITSLMLADTRGRESMLLYTGDAWISRESRADEWNRETQWLHRPALDANPTPSMKKLDYDCRTRPWFRAALETRDGPLTPRWTPPYIFFTTKEPGITASVAFEGDGGLRRVLGFDVLLKDLSEFTMALRPTPGGVVFLVTDDRRVLGLPAGADPSGLLKPPEEIGLPVIADADAAFRARKIDVGRAFRFRSGGEAYWGDTKWFPLDAQRQLGIAVVLPESDLLGDVSQQRLWILLATAAVLGFAAWYAMVLARRYSAPLQELARDSERIQRGDLEKQGEVKTNLVEVRKLASAHDRMRVALRSLLRLERDLQIARQIQQDTFPDRLPELAGYQLDAWSVPADETGGDTYDLVGLRSGGATGLVVQENPDTALLLLADASGHGIGPALSVTQVRAMLRMAARAGTDLASIVQHMNEQLYADLADDRFITAWFGFLDAPNHKLISFSAGQGPILHYRAAEDTWTLSNSNAPPLGVIDDLPIRIPEPLELEPGDLFAVISDGIFEYRGKDDEQFGFERTTTVLESHREKTPREILGELRAAVQVFAEGRAAEDDCTAILLKRET